MSILEIQAQNGLQLQALADIMADSRRVIVMTGAGISTNSGIPDFRSEGGLYTLIQEQFDTKAREQEKEAQQIHSDEGYFEMSLNSSMTSELSSETSTCKESSTAGQTFSVDTQDPKISDSNSDLENDQFFEGNYESLSSSQSSQVTDNGRRALSSKMKGKDLFDARIWADPLSTSVFYTFIAALRKKIRQEVHGTTPTHKFIRTLRDGGRLVRCYTQNIDGLEAREGLSTNLEDGKGNRARLTRKVLVKPRPESRPTQKSEMDGGCEVVQLHGDLEVLRCGLCQDLSSWGDGNTDFEQIFLDGKAPVCQGCIKIVETRQSRGRRATAIGTLRPNVVLYGEGHPSEDLISEMSEHDLGLGPDLLLIIGTSLRVHGLKVLIREFAKSVHCRSGDRGNVIFVNNTKPADSSWGDVIDYWVNMDCDEWIQDLKIRREDIWQRQGDAKLPRRKSTAAYLKNMSTQDDESGELAEVVTAAKILLEMSSSPPRPTAHSCDQDRSEGIARNEPTKHKAKRKYQRKSDISINIPTQIPHKKYSTINEPHVLPASPMTPTTKSVLDQLQAEYRHRPIPTPAESAKSSLTYILCSSQDNRKRKYDMDQSRVLQDISVNQQTPSRQTKHQLKSKLDEFFYEESDSNSVSFDIWSPSKKTNSKSHDTSNDWVKFGDNRDRGFDILIDQRPNGKRRRIITKRAAGLD